MSKAAQKTILIIAAGTGGHIFPALAIAKELNRHSVKIQWLGCTKGMENKLLPQYGFNLHTVCAIGLRGKNIKNLLKAPFLLGLAFFQTVLIFIKLKPDLVLGMGGFTAGIGGLVAWLLGVPLIIHEQNTIAGSSNKLLSKIASRTFQAFDGVFAAKINAVTVGNPILFTPKPKPKTKPNSKINLLVLGGSLGAKPINDIITKLQLNLNIWHQTGVQHLASVQSEHQTKPYKIETFIRNMAAAYAWADVVICRAGAMSVSELMLSGSFGILIPLPYAIDNHQFYNAKILTDNGAGMLIEQKNLSVELLTETLLNLDSDKINKLSKNALKLAKPFAAKEISDYIIKRLQPGVNAERIE